MTDTIVIDMKALERLHEWGGKRLVAQMIDLFLSQAPQRVAGLQDGLSDGDLELVERSAHSLKSTAANLGATGLSEAAAEAEAAAGEKNLDRVRELFPKVEAEFDRAREALALMEQETS
ncbi:MAG: Hpt domain-containing protein [Longimicrobiales bacterium]